MYFGCHQFPPKNEQKQVDLRFYSSKVEFVHSFFGRNVGLKNSFRLFLIFTKGPKKFWNQFCGRLKFCPAQIPKVDRIDKGFNKSATSAILCTHSVTFTENFLWLSRVADSIYFLYSAIKGAFLFRIPWPLVICTDYGHPMAKALILCCPNSNLNRK